MTIIAPQYRGTTPKANQCQALSAAPRFGGGSASEMALTADEFESGQSAKSRVSPPEKTVAAIMAAIFLALALNTKDLVIQIKDQVKNALPNQEQVQDMIYDIYLSP